MNSVRLMSDVSGTVFGIHHLGAGTLLMPLVKLMDRIACVWLDSERHIQAKWIQLMPETER